MRRAFSVALLLAASASLQAQAPACCTVTITARVPEGTGTVYLTGSLPALGPWRADGLALTGTGHDRSARLTVPPGSGFEYKFTLGTWEREALGYAGAVPPNYRLVVARDTTVVHDVADFKKPVATYIADWKGAGVRGTLIYWTDVGSAFLGPTRHVSIWLPPGYDTDTGRRYPVLYMHDGQNLFDPRIANTGTDWGVDEAVTRLVERGAIPPIVVVGVWNSPERGPEYSPWHGAARYARFLTEELMPRINTEFRTLTDAASTGVMGSSMGGLLSYYLVTRHPERFGSCGCLSTHFPLSEAVAARVMRDSIRAAVPDTLPYIVRDIASGLTAPAGARYWFDYGTRGLDAGYGPTHEAVRGWLLGQGKVEGRNFVVRPYPGADHNEASWRARLEDPLMFMFGQAALGRAPAWAADAIWYQIFPERFRNGDPSNDPTVADVAPFTPDPMPANWRPTPWRWDWYKQEPWAAATGKDFYGTAQFRRYGGDFQGVLDRLDYLQRLGVTALYFNPVNDAPSLHKYDTRSYHHMDRNFGPDPRRDEALMAAEDPADPATWRWTSADSLFLVLVKEVHRRGMKVLLDYSWNHTGVNFWAWRDVLARQQRSPYADWYEIQRFDDPATPAANEFAYRGWAGVPSLPEWKKVGRPAGKTHGPIEGNLVPGVREHVFAVTRRWLDPNGDGDPSDGVDGFRLDVADVVPLGFWRDYRRFVRSVNPEAYLVGEVWWEQWPDRMWDPRPWLQGDVFDAVMHYQWFTPTRSFFAGAPPQLTPTQYAATLDTLAMGMAPGFDKVLMNLTASHDTPRFSTAIYNPGKNKYQVTPRDNPGYKVDRPDDRTRRILAMILVQQYTWRGAPHIWNGDEVGMWGADDPDERKPVVWGDIRYDDETTHPFGQPRRRDRVEPDTALYGMHQRLIALRKAHLRVFVEGAHRWLVTDDAKGVLAYARTLGSQEIVVAFNRSERPREFRLPAGRYRELFATVPGAAQGTLLPQTARVWVRD
jgi:glycosidase/predicted alpha/beta superfamily hydrolase